MQYQKLPRWEGHRDQVANVKRTPPINRGRARQILEAKTFYVARYNGNNLVMNMKVEGSKYNPSLSVPLCPL